MSGYYNESDPYGDEERQGSGGGGGLRKQLEEALAENQRLRGRLEERESKSVTDLLKDKGIDPAVAEMVPKEDPKGWIEKYAHLLGAKPQRENLEDAPVPEPKVQAPEPAEEDPAVKAEREARAAMQESQDNGTPSVIHEGLLEQMGKIDSEEELLKFFNANG